MGYLFLIFLSLALNAHTPLEQLINGNDRYARDQLLHADHSIDRRAELVAGQAPFATIVSCSDSRVTPEIIFDQGVGDLFVVRVAGNVVGPIELDSIDYSVKVLGSQLIFVLGHESCGAVNAVLENKTDGIKHVAVLIKPAIKKNVDLETAIKENVKYVVANLQKRLKVECVGGYYHLESGKIEILH